MKPKIHSTNVEFQIHFQIFWLTWAYWSWATFEPISEDYQADQHKTLEETCMSRSALTVEVDVEFTVFLYLPFQR